jgi:hypothetical protein
MTYPVGVNINRRNVVPDLYDWLEEQGMEYKKDWTFERGIPSKDLAEFDYVFNFVHSEHAMMFKLRWA